MKIKIVYLLFIIGNYYGLNAQATNQPIPFTLPPPPEASALFKSTEIPVSLATGVPSITIPIYDISLGSFTLPIALNYNSSGVRVNEMASSVGLGWSLQVGGMISSTVVSLPDFGPEGYMDGTASFPEDRELEPEYILVGSNEYDINDDYNYLMSITGNKINNTSSLPIVDTQPDIFYYSFAGRSGKFFFTKNGNAHTVPYQPIEIKKEALGFVIKDERGVLYTFNVIEESHTSSSFYATDSRFGGGGNTVINYSYYLSKIQTPEGETITFAYRDVSYKYSNPTSYTRYRGTNFGWPSNVETRVESSTLIKGKIIESINSSRAHKIDFVYENCHRLDMPAEQSYPQSLTGNFSLKQINITKSGTVNKYTLNQEYFNLASYQPCITSNNDPDSVRLKLLSIQKEGEPSYEFEYFGNNILPNRLSESGDHWGYNSTSGGRYVKDIGNGFYDGSYRNPDLTATLAGTLKKIKYPTKGYSEFEYELNKARDTLFTVDPATQRYFDIYYDEVLSFQSINFSITPNVLPNSIFIKYLTTTAPAQANLYFNVHLVGPGIDRYFQSFGSDITSEYLNLQTGEYTLSVEQAGVFEEGFVTLNFAEELNNSTTEIINVEVGGLRIKKITEFDSEGSAPSLVRRFEYNMPDDETISSGKIANKPKYVSLISKYTREVQESFLIQDVAKYWSQNSSSIMLLAGLQGYHIMYSNVRMYRDDDKMNGYTDYKYSFVNDLKSYETVPATIPTSYDWQRGILLEESEFGYNKVLNKFNRVKRVKNDYKFLYTPPLFSQNYTESGAHYTPPTQPNENHALGLVVVCLNSEFRINTYSNPFGRYPAEFEISSYKLISSWYFLEKSTQELFDINGENPVITTTNYFYDNPTHAQISRSVSTSSNGKEVQTKTYYPDDKDQLIGLSYESIIAIDSLRSQHRITEPIQVENYKKEGAIEALLSTQRINFRDWGSNFTNSANIIRPETIQTSKGVNTLKNNIIYHSYDNKGNLTELSKEDGSHIIYIWGYNEQFPVAKLENAVFTDIPLAIFNEILSKSNLDIDIASEGALRTALNNLRIALPNAMVTTYTYDPLIGVTSITDPRGEIIYYHYDNFNRLEYVKDDQGNILNKNEYHYKNQQ